MVTEIERLVRQQQVREQATPNIEHMISSLLAAGKVPPRQRGVVKSSKLLSE